MRSSRWPAERRRGCEEGGGRAGARRGYPQGPGRPLPGLLREVLLEDVAGPGARRGEVSSGLGVGFGVSWDPSC